MKSNIGQQINWWCYKCARGNVDSTTTKRVAILDCIFKCFTVSIYNSRCCVNIIICSSNSTKVSNVASPRRNSWRMDATQDYGNTIPRIYLTWCIWNIRNTTNVFFLEYQKAHKKRIHWAVSVWISVSKAFTFLFFCVVALTLKRLKFLVNVNIKWYFLSHTR